MPSTGTNGAQGPKITPEVIESHIASEHYFTAGQGARAALIDAAIESGEILAIVDKLKNQDSKHIVPMPLYLMTFCVLVLKNGFTVVGKSAVASPSNFSQEIGRKVAREDAIRQIWPLLGYKLVEDLHQIRVHGQGDEDLGEAMTRLLAFQLGNEFALRPGDAELLLHKLEEKAPAQV